MTPASMHKTDYSLENQTRQSIVARFAPVVAVTQIIALIYLLLPAPEIVLWPRPGTPRVWRETCPLQPGQMAPNLIFLDAEGKQTTLEQMRGTPILLILANSCGPCTQAVLPEWRSVQNQYPSLRIVLVVPASLRELQSFQAALATFGLHVIALTSRGGHLDERYAPGFYPRAFYVDPAGRIAYIQGPHESVGETAVQVGRRLRVRQTAVNEEGRS